MLVKAINRLKKGDRQFRPTRLADDEIGEVVTAFNSLLDQRDHAEDQLLDHRASLEKVVDERTADLRGALKAAEKSNKSKSIFLANMSHELRTPMHAILSFSNLARKKVDDEKVLHYLDNIIISGNRLTELLNDLLDLSKLEAGKMDVDFQQMDMTQLVMDTCEEVKGLLQDKGISININSEQHYQCRFDRKLFAQVIMNLLSNAIKFSPESSVITVNIEQLQSKLHNRMQDVIKLAVIDEGVGIPKEELNSVFEQFEQSSKTSSASGGTGLGLSIARSIVHLHKGGIRAESPPKGLQKGSAFIIQIPVYADTDTPA